MTTVTNPTTYRFGGYFLVCPECHLVRWGSGRCAGCGARLVGPWRRSAWIDPATSNWIINSDGTATLVEATT